MSNTLFGPFSAAIAFVVVAITPPQGALAQQTQKAQSDVLPDSFSAVGSGISYFDTPNRKHTTIAGQAPTILGALTANLGRSGDVLVQFTSGLATVTDAGCPCSVRVSLKVDDLEPIVIKRINLGVRPAQVEDKYVPDRQSADGSYVFALGPGQHHVSLIAQQIEGTTADIQAFYTNMQALNFEKH